MITIRIDNGEHGREVKVQGTKGKEALWKDTLLYSAVATNAFQEWVDDLPSAYEVWNIYFEEYHVTKDDVRIVFTVDMWRFEGAGKVNAAQTFDLSKKA